MTGTVAAAAAAGAAFAWLLLEVINPQSFGWTVSLAVPWTTLAGSRGARARRVGPRRDLAPGRVAAAVDPAAALAEE